MVSGLSPFLKEKYTYLFRRFYDVNGDGSITQADFSEMLKNLQKLRGWNEGSAELRKCDEVLKNSWKALNGADANQDEEITLDEWHAYWATFVEQSKKSADGWPAEVPWVKDYMSLLFDLMDTSGDGMVGESEFIQVCTHFGVTEADAKAAFGKLEVPEIDRKHFAKLWLQYMTSEDKKAAGNFVFGRLNWD